ncbi:hypothetical protein ABRP29_07090 [Pseudomonas sp. WHRI 8822A]|uniref:hypothetical protein n=1 Tax=Pseudomonas sp. WHRI 8822A TaxID=3162568 RepID=UPI0032EC7CF2
MDELQVITRIIIELISNSSGELSARLKQRLNATLISQGRPALDEKRFGFRKFADFLKGPLGEYVKLEWPQGSGDVRVTLKHDVAPAPQRPVSRERRAKVDRPTALRSDVWQAFTNPDTSRKRFYNLITNRVIHYVEGANDDYQQLVESQPADFIEIVQIPEEAHRAWMREFLNLATVASDDLVTLQALVGSAYSSDLNAAFTKTLGDRGLQWRQMRTLKISERIQAWAVEHNIDPDNLSIQPTATKGPVLDRPAAPSGSIMSPRQQAVRLLELMSDEEILNSAIPVLLNSVLSKSKF